MPLAPRGFARACVVRLCLSLFVLAAIAPALCQAKPPSKVVVLGFDGADAELVETWMNEGKLPNLDRLRKTGTFSPLLPTNPPQTPVSWSTFATGLDPGGTEIFDFLKRSIDTYSPDFAMMTPSKAPFLFGPKNPLYLGLLAAVVAFLALFLFLRVASRRTGVALGLALLGGVGIYVGAERFVARNVPEQRPIAINNRKGEPFWQTLARHGVRSAVIRVPQTFPPDKNPGGRLLSGLGVPDVRGTFGTYTYYSSDPAATTRGGDTEKGGKVVIVDVEPGDRSVSSIIYGPFNKLFDDPKEPEILLPVTFELDWKAHSVRIEVDGQTITLKEHEWSDFVRFEFPIRKLVKVHGIARFHLLELDQKFRLYLSPVQIDPMKPILPVTDPPGFAKEIHDRIGDYPTLGWGFDTWALDEEVTDEKVFAEDYEFTTGKYEQILEAFLDDPNEQLYTQIFYFTDRVAHMFWRFLDPQNPAYDPTLAGEWGDFVFRSYQRMDQIVGKVLDRLPPDGLLLICSDHGFSTWRRSFNMNTWLVQNGFMTLKAQVPGKTLNLDDLFGHGQFWPNVDWERTRAYALGLGAVYINVLGRERQGIVTPGPEYDAVCLELKTKLEAFVDSTTGLHPVSRVYRRDEMYKSYDKNLMPDLRAANSKGYRVSWQTSLGGIPKELFDDHKSKWSGDHCSLDPTLVKGILFSSRPLALAEEPGIEDLCPTLLQVFGAPIPEGLAGAPLPFRP